MSKYLDFYKKHHADTRYGTSGRGKVKFVQSALVGHGIKTILDWGAGSQGLAHVLSSIRPDWQITSYDAAVPGIDTRPNKTFDAVVSTDVLEHIPYDEIDDVIEDILELTGEIGYHHIATSPAQLFLPDGQNAHLIQEMAPWWAKKFEAHGVEIIEAWDTGKPDGRQYTAANIKFRRIRDRLYTRSYHHRRQLAA